MSTENKLAQPQSPTQAQAEKIEQRPVVAPTVDVFENENELLVVADLPGVSQDQMSIHFDKGRLTIEGKRLPARWSPRMAEAENADFRRTFLVPQGIDAEHISAELLAGVLADPPPQARQREAPPHRGEDRAG